MNGNTKYALIDFVKSIPMAVCKCSLKERFSGHTVECAQPELEEKADRLIAAIVSDETILDY